MGSGHRQCLVEVVAHRAGNSLDAAESAVVLWRDGLIDAVEVDVHVHRGRLEVRHAKVIRPTNRMWDGWAILPASTEMLYLDEVLGVLGPDVQLLVDLKCFTTRAARRIRDAIPDGQKVIASTRSWWVLRAFADRPQTRTLRSCGNRWQVWVARRLPDRWSSDGVAVHEQRLTATIVRDLLERVGVVFTWGATTSERCVELSQFGVTGLILDDPTICAT